MPKSLTECYHCNAKYAPNLVQLAPKFGPMNRKVYLCDACWNGRDGYREHGCTAIGHVTLVPV